MFIMKKLTITFLMLMAFSFSVTAENAVTIKGYKYRDYDENNKLKHEVFGDTCVILGEILKLDGVLIRMLGGKQPMTVKTPYCRYDKTQKTGSSSKPVEAQGDGITITGVGFDLDGKKQKLYIRSQVKVIWKKKKSKKLDDR